MTLTELNIILMKLEALRKIKSLDTRGFYEFIGDEEIDEFLHFGSELVLARGETFRVENDWIESVVSDLQVSHDHSDEDEHEHLTFANDEDEDEEDDDSFIEEKMCFLSISNISSVVIRRYLHVNHNEEHRVNTN